MKLYGKMYKINTRKPQNVNIAVNSRNIQNAYNALYRVASRKGSPLMPNVIKRGKPHYKLRMYDLLLANSNLAPKIDTYYLINGVPVVPVSALLNQKKKTFGGGQKTQQNIETLQRIKNAFNKRPLPSLTRTKRESPLRRSPTPNNNVGMSPGRFSKLMESAGNVRKSLF